MLRRILQLFGLQTLIDLRCFRIFRQLGLFQLGLIKCLQQANHPLWLGV